MLKAFGIAFGVVVGILLGIVASPIIFVLIVRGVSRLLALNF